MWVKRKNTRLQSYDYSQSGWYFITICTKDRQQTLARVCRGGALLLPLGRLVEKELLVLPKQYPVQIIKYVIMPNHIHIILSLEREEQSPSPTSLTEVICRYKSITTKQANQIDGVKGRQIWQRSYHDHIIRNERQYLDIWKYIDENPLKWQDDCYYIYTTF